jgi:hypothetical protein
MPQSVDLAQNRILVIRQNGLRYSLTASPIPETVWLESFFDAITAFVTCGSDSRESHTDARSAGVALLEKVAIEAQGYPHLADAPDWQSKVPLAHRVTFSEMLVEAYELDDDEPILRPTNGTRAVRLQALWGAVGAGSMCRHRDLVHHFKAPSVQQKGRYHAARAGVRRAVSGARRGSPVILSPVEPLQARTLVALYDELVLRVEGYAFNGEPLPEDRVQIKAHMDAFHKVQAARPLFSRRSERRAT